MWKFIISVLIFAFSSFQGISQCPGGKTGSVKCSFRDSEFITRSCYDCVAQLISQDTVITLDYVKNYGVFSNSDYFYVDSICRTHDSLLLVFTKNETLRSGLREVTNQLFKDTIVIVPSKRKNEYTFFTDAKDSNFALPSPITMLNLEAHFNSGFGFAPSYASFVGRDATIIGAGLTLDYNSKKIFYGYRVYGSWVFTDFLAGPMIHLGFSHLTNDFQSSELLLSPEVGFSLMGLLSIRAGYNFNLSRNPVSTLGGFRLSFEWGLLAFEHKFIPEIEIRRKKWFKYGNL